MTKDKWKTPDGYHFQDIIDNGRCEWCGQLANSTVLLRTGKDAPACSRLCRSKISELHSKITKTASKGQRDERKIP